MIVQGRCCENATGRRAWLIYRDFLMLWLAVF